MNFRDRLKRKAIKTKDPVIWDQFRIVKNQVNGEINSAKKAYYENAFNNCCGDQRKTWKTINELTSRKSTKTVINEMEYNGVNSGDQTDIAEMLNSFFTEIGPGLSRDVSEVDKSFEEFLIETDKNFVFEKTTPTHVFALLSKLCKSKATGLDNISAKLLRECPDVLAEHKNTGKRSDLTNYRPISIIPVVAKVFERIIYDQLYRYLTNNNFLRPSIWFSVFAFHAHSTYRSYR